MEAKGGWLISSPMLQCKPQPRAHLYPHTNSELSFEPIFEVQLKDYTHDQDPEKHTLTAWNSTSRSLTEHGAYT
jgi:hypothetical protein